MRSAARKAAACHNEALAAGGHRRDAAADVGVRHFRALGQEAVFQARRGVPDHKRHTRLPGDFHRHMGDPFLAQQAAKEGAHFAA